MWRQHTQRLPMILSDSLLGVEIFDLMIWVDSKQNVGNISLNITKNYKTAYYSGTHCRGTDSLSDFVTNS